MNKYGNPSAEKVDTYEKSRSIQDIGNVKKTEAAGREETYVRNMKN